MDSGATFDLPAEEAHHVSKVLRARSGDVFEVVDSGRRLFLAELRGGNEAAVLEELAVPDGNGARVILYQAVPKGRHMDLVVEKATEIGVDLIIPLVTDRGVVRLDGGAGKVARWRRVAEAAARQSLRLRVPEVGEPVSFSEAVSETDEGGILLHNGDGLPRLEDVAGPEEASLFVGPEGGWSEPELSLAEESGLALARLGPYRLRSETAGVVAVARARAALETAVEHT
ncbi:MAG: RsmE family RNA methyltransferase [Rubrobacteraceae bacterium]|nr:16S rRNA (uracil(1498)-N(3))-methyltransferase [Rubrobacter sp.]